MLDHPRGHLMDTNELIQRFRRHQDPSEETRSACVFFHDRLLDVVAELNQLTPDSREKALALTHLEEVMMWVDRAIERNGVLS